MFYLTYTWVSLHLIAYLQGDFASFDGSVEIALEVDVPSFTRMGAKDRHLALITTGPTATHAAAFKLPEGDRCAGISFYKPGALTLLRDGAGASTLAVIDYSEVSTRVTLEPQPFGSLMEACVVQGGLGSWSDLMQEESEAEGPKVRSRELPGKPAPSSSDHVTMSSSGNRGLGFVCLEKHRVLVYDLEAEEE